MRAALSDTARPALQQQGEGGGTGFRNVTLTLFSLFLSSLVRLVCLPHLSSHKRRLVARRCLLPEKLCSPALNCFCVTERKRSNLQPVSTPHISSQETLKRYQTCRQLHFLTKCTFCNKCYSVKRNN